MIGDHDGGSLWPSSVGGRVVRDEMCIFIQCRTPQGHVVITRTVQEQIQHDW